MPTFLTATNEVHNLHLIARLHHRRLEGAALQHDEVVFDGDAPGSDVQTGETIGDGQRGG